MSLYDGFNALGIGGAANDTHERRRVRNREILDLLNKFGNTAVDAYGENKRKESLMAGAKNLGVPDELASGMDTAELARFLQGIKTQKDEEQEQKLLFDREDAIKAKERSEATLDKGFSALKDMLLQQMAKASGPIPSQKDIDEYNRAYNAMKKFVGEHPEYGIQMADIFEQNGKGYSGVKSLESYFDEIGALNKNGVVDAKEMDALKKKYIEDNVLATLMEDKNFTNKWDMLAGMINGTPEERNALMLGSGKNETEGDAQRKLDEINREKAVAAEKKRMAEWYKLGEKGGIYDFSKAQKLGIKIPQRYQIANNKRKGKKDGKK